MKRIEPTGFRRSWSKTDLATLKKMAPDFLAIDIAKKLGRTIHSVRLKASKSHIKLSKYEHREWSAKEDRLLKQFGTKRTDTAIANLLKNRNPKMVAHRRKRLQLTKTQGFFSPFFDEVKQSILRGEKQK